VGFLYLSAESLLLSHETKQHPFFKAIFKGSKIVNLQINLMGCLKPNQNEWSKTKLNVRSIPVGSFHLQCTIYSINCFKGCVVHGCLESGRSEVQILYRENLMQFWQ